MGLNCNPHGVFADQALCAQVSLLRALLTDWMHDELQDGVFAVEMDMFMQACEEKINLRPSHLNGFFGADWKFSAAFRVKGTQLKHLFRPRGGDDHAEHLKFGASELLCAYALMRHFAAVYLTEKPVIRAEWESFRLACAVIDCYQKVKSTTLRGLSAAALETLCSELEAAMQAHVRTHIATYGDERIKPKHNFRLHVPDQIRRIGFLVDAFVLERLNHWVKAKALHVLNTVRFERSILALLLLEQEHSLRGRVLGDKLEGPQARCPWLESQLAANEVIVARRLECGGNAITVGDMVTKGSGQIAIGSVKACAAVDGELVVIVEPLLDLTQLADKSFSGTASDNVVVWDASGLRHTAAWHWDGLAATCLLP